MEWNNLKAQTVKALEESLSDILVKHSKEQFYAVALYTDSSAMTIGLAVNSLEALEAKLDAEDEEDRDDCKSYYKWATSEWVYEGWGGQEFEGICKLLRNSDERKDFDGFREKVISLMIESLKDAGRSVFFEAAFPNRPIMFVTITDDNSAEEVENYSAKILNSDSVFKDFLLRYKL